MKITIIGAGNVAHFLAHAFIQKGHQVVEILDRNAEKGLALAIASEALYIKNIRDLSPNTDAVFIAVNDDAIKGIAQKIKIKNSLLIHCAGSKSVDLINSPLNACGVLWPVYSINKNNLPINQSIPLAIDAKSPECLRRVRAMAEVISDNIWELSFEQRKKLHLGATISNNFIHHLLAISKLLLKSEQLPFEALIPIITQTFNNEMQSTSLKAVQTGPAIRRDNETIQEHLKLLTEYPALYSLYESFTTSIQELNPLPNN